MGIHNVTQGFEELGPARKTVLAGLLLFTLSFAAYSNSFNGCFFLDDTRVILLNNNIRSLSNIKSFFTEAKETSYQKNYRGYRPVTFTVFSVIYYLFGYRVWGYHLFNILFHFMNAFLVYLIAKYVLKEGGMRDGSLMALIASSAFALHPIETAAVTYICGMFALLASLFFLTAFYSFLRFRSDDGPQCLWASLAPVLYLAGLLSKEMAVSLPAVMLAYDLLFTVPKRGGLSRSVRTWLYYIPFAAVLAAYLPVKKAMQGGFSDRNIPYTHIEYLMSQGKALLMYLKLLLLPVNQNADYNLSPTTSPDAWVVLSFVLVLVSIVLLYRLRVHDKAAAFFGFWFFITLAPESSLVPIRDIAFEHRLYLPSAGFIAAAVILAARLPSRMPAMKTWAGAGVLGLFLILTLHRNTVWQSASSIWSDVARKSPGSYRAHEDLGDALVGEGRYKEALDEFLRAVPLKQDTVSLALLYADIGTCLYNMDMPEDAYRMFDRGIAINPGVPELYEYKGELYYKQGRYVEAVAVLGKAVSIDPAAVPAHLLLAKSYARLGLRKESLAAMKEAQDNSKDDFVISYDLAVIYESNGMLDDALRQADMAAELPPAGPQRKKADELVGRITRKRDNPQNSR